MPLAFAQASSIRRLLASLLYSSLLSQWLALVPLYGSFTIATPSDSVRHLERPYHHGQTVLDSIEDGLPSSRPPELLDTPRSIQTYREKLVLRFNVSNSGEARELLHATDYFALDVWSVTSAWVDLRLTESQLAPLLDLLSDSLRIAYLPLLQGQQLQDAVVATYTPADTPSADDPKSNAVAFSTSLRDADINEFFREYRPLSIIKHWIHLLQSLFPASTRLVEFGKSYEGREILGIRVGVRPQYRTRKSETRKTILIVGGVHAREWISTTTVNYIAHAFVTGYGKDSRITKLVEMFDWIFVPTVNPDGYEYTWSSDRLWRKNRQPTTVPFCKGIDLDRSWDFMWTQQPSNGDGCSETFSGSRPFEAVESQVLAEWALNQTRNHNTEFISFVDLHAYSEQILVPYSYSCMEDPPTLEDLEEVGHGLAKAIRRKHRENYQIVRACKGNVLDRDNTNSLAVVEGAGGSPLDWWYTQMNLRTAFQIKLRDTGSYGFLLPKQYIIPSGEEMLEATLHLGKVMSSSSKKDDISTINHDQ